MLFVLHNRIVEIIPVPVEVILPIPLSPIAVYFSVAESLYFYDINSACGNYYQVYLGFMLVFFIDKHIMQDICI